MKFRKRIRVFPGFTVNLSRSGISSTVGILGLSLNLSKNGTTLNTGIPGTGLYDRQYLGKGQKKSTSEIKNSDTRTNVFSNNSSDWMVYSNLQTAI